MGWINTAGAVLWQAGWRLRQGFRPRNEIVTYGSLAEALKALNGGAVSKAGPLVTVDRAMQSGAVYACVRVIADTHAQLPLVTFRRLDEERRERARNNTLYGLLHDRVNEWQTSFEWRQLKQRDLLLRGNAYSLIVRGFGGRIVELLRIHPDRVSPKQDSDTLAVTYELTREDGRRIELPRSEVLHIRGLGDDGVCGVNPIHWYREVLGDSLAAQEHGSRFWSNGAKLLGLLETNPEIALDEPDRKAVREDFDQMYRGGENAYKTAILPRGMSYKPVGISNEDAQFLETRKFSRSEIAGIFRVPPHKIGDLERATFSNIEHQALEFVTDTMLPWLINWEQAIQRDLLAGEDDLFAKFIVDGLLRGDAKSRAEALQIQRRNGVINANEWRQIEDRNPREDPGGEEYIVESNMQPQGAGAEDGSQPPANGTRQTRARHDGIEPPAHQRTQH